MVQLYNFLKRLFSKKSKSKAQTLLSFNAEVLGTKMQKLSVDMFRCRQEDAIKVIKDVFETARNIQIIEINRFKDGNKIEQLNHQLGRLEAFSDLLAWIEMSLDPEIYKERKEPMKKNIKILSQRQERSPAI